MSESVTPTTPVRDAAAVTFGGLLDQIGTLEVGLGLSNAERDAALAENVVLRKRIADLEGPPPPDPDPEPPVPPPVARRMPVGAVIGAQCHSLPDFISRIGTPGVRRYYCGSGFGALAAKVPAAVQDSGRWDQVISFKPGRTLDKRSLRALLDSLAMNNRLKIICCENEPERTDKNTGDLAAAGRAFVAFADAFSTEVCAWLDETGRTDVLPGFPFSYWRPLTDPTISAWWPTKNLDRMVFCIQPYDPQNRKSFAEQAKGGLDRWFAVGGRLWAATEIGTHRLGADAERWIRDGVAWSATYPTPERGCLAWVYYDDVVGKDGPWCVIDQGQIAGLKATMPSIPVPA